MQSVNNKMAKYIKLDMVDVDDETISIVEAPNIQNLLEIQISNYKTDNRPGKYGRSIYSIGKRYGVTPTFSSGTVATYPKISGIDVKYITCQLGDSTYPIAWFALESDRAMEVFAEKRNESDTFSDFH